MELIVEVVSKTGKGAGRGLKAKGHENWFNAGRGMSGNFTSLTKGTKIDAEVDGNFINSFEVLNAATATEAIASLPVVGNRDAKITLGNAFNAVFAPVYTASRGDSESHEQAFELACSAVAEAAKRIAEAQ